MNKTVTDIEAVLKYAIKKKTDKFTHDELKSLFMAWKLGDDHDGEPPGRPGLVNFVTRVVLDEPGPQFVPLLARRYAGCPFPLNAPYLDSDRGAVSDIE